MRSLTELSLSTNSLNGSIPASLGNLTKLTTLLLRENHLSSSILEEIGYLKTLNFLDLSTNFLNGSIPASLGNLNGLYLLSLYAKNLSGHVPSEIPQQLAALMSLAFLNLSHNHLQGCIRQRPQFATFEKYSFEGNDGLRGFSVSKGCGNDGVSETNHTTPVLDEESNSEFLNDFWKASLMGFGSGLCIGLSILYFMISTRNPKWCLQESLNS
ncbi:hypothetical protein HAX54_002948 [Datura stramonium]|uniref:Uncharacterized protein n=1 Tax=Datura stramonium TaxID=4076 RepID=A0ABS8T5V6_DATST|nr:hypothetical protein [Datura stramonium]